MSEQPSIPGGEIKIARGYLLFSAELAAEHQGLAEDLADLLAGHPSRHPTPPSVPRPTAYDRLLETTDGLVREIVELHQPTPYEVDDRVVEWKCHGCDFTGYEAEPVAWPCDTTGLIATHVGVDLREPA